MSAFHGGSLAEKETDISCVNRVYCRVGSEVSFLSLVNQLCSANTYEPKAPATVQSAAAAANDLSTSNTGSPHDAKASKFNHESF